MLQIVIAVAMVVLGSALGGVLRRRRTSDAPTQPRLDIPAQLDRSDFPNITAPWVVAVFSSASCDACASVMHKADGGDINPQRPSIMNMIMGALGGGLGGGKNGAISGALLAALMGQRGLGGGAPAGAEVHVSDSEWAVLSRLQLRERSRGDARVAREQD